MQGLNVTKPGCNRAPCETVLMRHADHKAHEINNTKTIFFGQPVTAAKLAAVDAMLYVAEHTPPGFRSLRHEEVAGECWTNTWPEHITNLAKFIGVDAIIANQGVFLIAERVRVCHEDELGRPASEVEPGWHRVKFFSIDGKARPLDRHAPQILISPDEQCFLWQPEGGLKNQKRLTFLELLSELADMGERLARFVVAA